MNAETMSLDDREVVLIGEIARYTQDGWIVRTQTVTTAQLTRPRPLNVTTAILSLLFCGFGLAIYLAHHFAQGEQSIYLAVTDAGHVETFGERNGPSRQPSPASGWACAGCGYRNAAHLFDCTRCGARRQ